MGPRTSFSCNGQRLIGLALGKADRGERGHRCRPGNAMADDEDFTIHDPQHVLEGTPVRGGDGVPEGDSDILTVPPKFFPQLCAHPKTDEAVNQFVTDFRKWQGDVHTNGIGKAA